MLRLILFSILIYISIAERQYLDENRDLKWQTGNPNNGVYRGQPEQIHLSYGGLSFL